MGLYDDRTRRTLELLRAAADDVVRLADLRHAGIDNPAQSVYELELAGHRIERSSAGIRLQADARSPNARLVRRRRRKHAAEL